MILYFVFTLSAWYPLTRGGTCVYGRQRLVSHWQGQLLTRWGGWRVGGQPVPSANCGHSSPCLSLWFIVNNVRRLGRGMQCDKVWAGWCLREGGVKDNFTKFVRGEPDPLWVKQAFKRGSKAPSLPQLSSKTTMLTPAETTTTTIHSETMMETSKKSSLLDLDSSSLTTSAPDVNQRDRELQ